MRPPDLEYSEMSTNMCIKYTLLLLICVTNDYPDIVKVELVDNKNEFN